MALNGPDQPSDDEIRKTIHHQDFNIRNIAAFKALGINSGYIGRKSGGGKVRPDLVMEFLQHKDPRVRRVMFGAILNRTDLLTPEIFELAVQAVSNPEESWWIKDAAIQLIGRGSADQIVPLVDLLLPYLKHEEAWLRNAALTALTPVAADEVLRNELYYQLHRSDAGSLMWKKTVGRQFADCCRPSQP